MPVKPDEVMVLFPGLTVTAAGWILTIPEDRFLRDAMNLLGHACRAGNTLLLASRIDFTFFPGEGSRP